MKYVYVYLVVINILFFFIYGIDKKKAQKKQWRISENSLLLGAFLGGSLGAFLAMRVFHHKTKHWKFKICVPLFLVIHIVCLYLC